FSYPAFAYTSFGLNPLSVFANYYQDNFAGTPQNYRQYEAVVGMTKDYNVVLETAVYYIEEAKDRDSLLRAKMLLEHCVNQIDLAHYEKHTSLPANQKNQMDKTFRLVCYYMVRTYNLLGMKSDQARIKALYMKHFPHMQDQFYTYVRDYL
ncbi:MAG: hypothetical protein LBT68_05575, partial [Spirochaetales bacterium]|nr:hypothetical protein [Spirochaetales bacterium]